MFLGACELINIWEIPDIGMEGRLNAELNIRIFFSNSDISKAHLM